MESKIFVWDWKDQPPLKDICDAVTKIAASGSQVYTCELQNQVDMHIWIVADHSVTQEEAEKLFWG